MESLLTAGCCRTSTEAQTKLSPCTKYEKVKERCEAFCNVLSGPSNGWTYHFPSRTKSRDNKFLNVKKIYKMVRLQL